LAWQIEYADSVEKDLRRIDTTAQKRIKKFLDSRIAHLSNPRSIGEALKGPLGEFWKYRVGDYRIICDIKDNVVTILVLTIGDRKQVYRQ
jgi:mRNA interferase RelE/StbE